MFADTMTKQEIGLAPFPYFQLYSINIHTELNGFLSDIKVQYTEKINVIITKGFCLNMYNLSFNREDWQDFVSDMAVMITLYFHADTRRLGK